MSTDPLGADAGSVGPLDDANLSNDYSTIPDQSVESVADRVTPGQVASGTSRGTQTVTGTDGSRLTFGVVDGAVQLGVGMYDVSGKKIAQLGQQADGSTSLKFFDVNGFGIAQFGRDKNGAVALKVAKPGIEVGNASNDQLVFNSAQNMFKVVSSGTYSIPATTLPNGQNFFNGTTIPHGLPYVPIVQAYAQVTTAVYNGSGFNFVNGYAPMPITASSGQFLAAPNYSGPGALTTAQIVATSDATNIYFSAQYVNTSGASVNVAAVPIKYYLLQETAA